MTKQSATQAKTKVQAKSPKGKGKATKPSAVKKTTNSKKNQQEYQSMKRAFFTSLAVFLLAVSTVVVMSFLAAHTIVAQESNARLTRIKDIYANLNLGDEYTVTSANVFGDRRVYKWDKDRTYSSEIDYLHGDTVANTVADLDAKIKASGFAFVGEPYPGSKTVQYHYKSASGEYIRLTVGSKQYYDALINANAMKEDAAAAAQSIDTNAAPAQVIIKVNLDDNNE